MLETNLYYNNNEIYIYQKKHSASPSAVSIFDLIIVMHGSFSPVSFYCSTSFSTFVVGTAFVAAAVLLWHCVFKFLIFCSAILKLHTHTGTQPRNNNQHGEMTRSFSLIFGVRLSADSIMVCSSHPN